MDDYTRSVATKWGIDPDVVENLGPRKQLWAGERRATADWPFQLHFAPDGRAMGDDFRRDTGLDPRDPKTWKDR